MDLSWEKIDIHFFSKQSKDSTIGDSQGCGLSIRSNSPNSPNFWQSKLLEPWNVQYKNSPFDPRFFLPSFLHSLHSGLGFLFSAQNARLFNEKNWMSAILSWKNLKNLQKSRSSFGWISHHSYPFIPIPRSRKFHAQNIALPRRSGYYRTSDERKMTEVTRSCSDREIAIQVTHGPSICAHNPHHNDFPYKSSVQMWKKKSHLRLADSLPPPTLFEASHGFFFLTLSTNSFQVSSDTCCRHLRPFPPGLKDKKQGFFKKHFPRKFLWLPPRFSRLSGAPGSSSCYTWKQSNFPEWNCTSWNIREKWRNARNQHAPKYEPLPKGWVL